MHLSRANQAGRDITKRAEQQIIKARAIARARVQVRALRRVRTRARIRVMLFCSSATSPLRQIIKIISKVM